MNRTKRILPFLTLLIAITSFFSCGVDRWPEYYPRTGRDLWIDSIMREDYLWYADLPTFNDLNYFQDPETFLNNMLPSYDNFSTVDTLYTVPLPSYGMNCTFYSIANRDTVVEVTERDTLYAAQITYIATGSPAEQAGLKRGEWILTIDGDSINDDRQSLLTDGSSRLLGMGKYHEISIPDEETTEDDSIVISYLVTDRNVTLPAATAVYDSPIHVKNIYQSGSAVIGYLAYHSFVAGSTENEQEYNDQLRAFSQECQTAGVNEFILDLRYNTGGEMECAQLLAAILAPAEALDNIFALLRYSDKQSARNTDLTINSELLQSGVNLNLSKLYVITSSQTAGAAETLINCLHPYMDVETVGSTTKGEYVATVPYVSTRYAWTLRPVVCEVYNAYEEYHTSGITADHGYTETGLSTRYLPLGDTEETLLNATLNIILGNTAESNAAATSFTPSPAKSLRMKRPFRKGIILSPIQLEP